MHNVAGEQEAFTERHWRDRNALSGPPAAPFPDDRLMNTDEAVNLMMLFEESHYCEGGNPLFGFVECRHEVTYHSHFGMMTDLLIWYSDCIEGLLEMFHEHYEMISSATSPHQGHHRYAAAAASGDFIKHVVENDELVDWGRVVERYLAAI